MKKSVGSYLLKRPLFYAGIASIVLIFVSMISNSLSFLFGSSVLGVVYSVITCLVSVLFFYGFYVIGDKYDGKLLKVLSILGFIGTIIIFLGSIFLAPSLNEYALQANQTTYDLNSTLALAESNSNLSLEQIEAARTEFSLKILEIFAPFIFAIIILLFIFVVYSILYGVALIKLGPQVNYAKVTGILEIVGACTLIIGVGLFILMVAFVFEIVILFDQAKKFKEF